MKTLWKSIVAVFRYYQGLTEDCFKPFDPTDREAYERDIEDFSNRPW